MSVFSRNRYSQRILGAAAGISALTAAALSAPFVIQAALPSQCCIGGITVTQDGQGNVIIHFANKCSDRPAGACLMCYASGTDSDPEPLWGFDPACSPN